MKLPPARGLASEAVFARLRGSDPSSIERLRRPADPWSDDFQILLWSLQQMAYRRFDDVDPAWETEPSLAWMRQRLELDFEAALRERVGFEAGVTESAPDAIRRLIRDADGPSLSAWMDRHGTLDTMREFATHRAAYQRQEADPHSFAISRLASGRAKRALLKIQLDEYGQAEPGQAHADLFADTMALLEVSLDIDALPASTLRTNTLLNMVSNSRRLLGACVGHLAVFEMCSVEPMSRYASTLRRLLPAEVASSAARFFDVHVAADGWHQELAITELVEGFVEQYPDEAGEVVFGAAALMLVEAEFAGALLDAWSAGQSSLRQSSDAVHRAS